MQDRLAKSASIAAKSIQSSINEITKLPSETVAPRDQPVIPHSTFNDSRGYIKKVVYQINRSYQHTCYDACAVMIRRLLEILIIECFESKGIASKIKDGNNEYFFLDRLIDLAIQETSWSLSKNGARLKRLKEIGDQSAHSRNYNAKREYIDDIIIDFRTVAEALLYISGLKK